MKMWFEETYWFENGFCYARIQPRRRLPVVVDKTVHFRVPVLVNRKTSRPLFDSKTFHHPRAISRLRVTGFLLALMLGLVISPAADVRKERWRWSNPLPHGNNVLDMLVTTDVAVQAGDGGTVYVQRTDERWAPAVTGVTYYLRSVALMGEQFIVVGENGCILWSDYGDYFQPAQLSPATADWFEGVTASAQRAVAVGDNGSIYTSTNGVNWNKATSGTTEWLRGVAFGNGAFVAVGENGKILRSTGGTS
jgi:hypothetical protein